MYVLPITFARELTISQDELLRNSDDDTPPPGAVDLLSGDELKRIARKIGAEGAAEEDDALITASARRRSVALRQGLLDEFERDSNRVVLDLCGSAGVGELERRGRGVWEWLSGVGASKALPPPTAGLGKWGESIVLAFEGTGVPPVSLLLFSTVSGVGSEPERRIVARWLFLLSKSRSNCLTPLTCSSHARLNESQDGRSSAPLAAQDFPLYSRLPLSPSLRRQRSLASPQEPRDEAGRLARPGTGAGGTGGRDQRPRLRTTDDQAAWRCCGSRCVRYLPLDEQC